MIRSPHPRAAAILAMCALAACSSAARVGGRSAPTPSTSNPITLDPVARARADSVRRPYTDADVQFMTGMIHHHAQALIMAAWAPTHNASASVRTLCERIINAQQDEILTMQTWLRDRSKPAPDPTPTGMKMTMGGKEHTMLMPGMLTDAQMHQLDAARGPEFDRLFLTFMIQHHRGAIVMVRDLFATPGAGQDELVFKFASDVQVDQTTEIARMERMLFSIATQHSSS